MCFFAWSWPPPFLVAFFVAQNKKCPNNQRHKLAAPSSKQRGKASETLCMGAANVESLKSAACLISLTLQLFLVAFFVVEFQTLFVEHHMK